MTKTPKGVLVVGLDAYHRSTRAKKAARAFADSGARVHYLGLSRPGRSGRWGDPGDFLSDGISGHLVEMRAPESGTSLAARARNALLSYCPAMFRLAWRALIRPADLVHVVSPPMLLAGGLHHARFGSRLVLDIPERPGAVAAPGSLTSVFARVEKTLLRTASRFVGLATVATPPDVETVRQLGFSRVVLVRNAPQLSWRRPFKDLPSDQECIFVTIGTIFPGRAFEALIDAVSIAAQQAPIRLVISGTASPEYLSELKHRATQVGASPYICWRGWVDPQDVCDRYLDGHVGLVLYETTVGGNDGLSNKLLECVSAGRPVLATNAPLNQEFVAEHEVGWTAPSDAQGLAQAMISAARAPREELAILAARCRRLGDEELSWEQEFRPVIKQLRDG